MIAAALDDALAALALLSAERTRVVERFVARLALLEQTAEEP
jgi:hypothetical protein